MPDKKKKQATAEGFLASNFPWLQALGKGIKEVGTGAGKAIKGAVTPDVAQFGAYQGRGGDLSYYDWLYAGRPDRPIARATPRTAALNIAEETRLGLPPSPTSKRAAAGEPLTVLQTRQLEQKPTPPPTSQRVGQPTGNYKTIEGWIVPEYFGADGVPYLNWDAARQQQLPAAGFPTPTSEAPKDKFGRVAQWNPQSGVYSFPPNWDVDPRTLEAGYNPNLIPTPSAEAPTDPYGRKATWDADNGEWRYPPDWGRDPATLKAGYISPYEQTQLDLRQKELEATTQWQQSQLAAERQRQLASLRASPSSWLEYASLAGETPAIQPWMQPLMPQQYGFQAGQPLPGWTPEGSLGGMPALTKPSAQYLSRVGPTATQQFYGYEQARTGAPPQETEWRQWAGSPPGGRFGGLARTR